MSKNAVSYYTIVAIERAVQGLGYIWALFTWPAAFMKKDSDGKIAAVCFLTIASVIVPFLPMIPPDPGRRAPLPATVDGWAIGFKWTYAICSGVILFIRGIAWSIYFGDKGFDVIKDKHEQLHANARVYKRELALKKERAAERGTLSDPHIEGGQLSHSTKSGNLSHY